MQSINQSIIPQSLVTSRKLFGLVFRGSGNVADIQLLHQLHTVLINRICILCS